MFFDSDKQAVDACIQSIGCDAAQTAGIIRIVDTKSLEFLQVSKSFENTIRSDPSLTQVSTWESLYFDSNDNLPPFQC